MVKRRVGTRDLEAVQAGDELRVRSDPLGDVHQAAAAAPRQP